MTTATETIQPATSVEHDHIAAARRYIAAIVVADKVLAMLGETHRASEAERLLEQFVERYAIVTSGAYAKHGADALRIALSSL